jgi:hypothetical protein
VKEAGLLEEYRFERFTALLIEEADNLERK